MVQVPIHNIGSIGVVKDTPAHLLPPEAWTDAVNVEFDDNKALKTQGYAEIYDPPTVAPYWLISVFTGSSRVWVYAGLTDAYVISGGTHTEITRVSGDYTGTAIDRWIGGILGGIPVFTNGVDDPQSWDPQTVATKLVDLPNWPASTLCKNIKPFKNYLVALDITKAGARFPHMVKWSHSAIPGAIPNSWDESDPTKDAGEKEVGDTNQGPLVDQLPLGDVNLIYKENSTWGMQFIGGQFIFRFFKVFPSGVGLLAPHCVAQVPKNDLHFMATPDDLIIHAMADPTSVLDKRRKKWLAARLSSTQAAKSFVTIDYSRDQMWFCFAEEGETWPNLALTWEWTTGALGTRELSPAAHMAVGPVPDLVTDTWDSDAAVWNSDSTLWDFEEGRPTDQLIVQADPVNTKLYLHNRTNQANAVNITSRLERTGLAIIGQDRQGNPKVDLQRRKMASRIWPKMRGGPVNVYLGSQEFIDGPITWVGPEVFTPGIDAYVDIVNQGLLLGVKFESTGDVFWELDGYDIDVLPLGQF